MRQVDVVIESEDDLDDYMDSVYAQFLELDDISFNANVQPIIAAVIERYMDLPLAVLMELKNELEVIIEREKEGQKIH